MSAICIDRGDGMASDAAAGSGGGGGVVVAPLRRRCRRRTRQRRWNRDGRLLLNYRLRSRVTQKRTTPLP
jgi:hypothetical protein